MSSRSRPSFFYFSRLLRVHFYTSSLDKLAQAKYVFERTGCKLEHYKGKTEPYDEDYSDGTHSLLEKAVKQVRDDFAVRGIFFVEDTSLRIEALSGETDFPGVAVKEWFEETTFADLDKQLKEAGSDRSAIVKSDIALHVPGLDDPVFFHGETRGTVAASPPSFKLNPAYQWLTPNNFNGWFIPDGETRRLGELEPERSLQLDFRAKSLSLLLDRLYEYNSALALEGSLYISRKSPVRFQDELPLVGRRVVAAIGSRCAGKTTLGDYLRSSYGAIHLEASTILRELARKRGEVVATSADAIAFLRKHGFDVVAREIAKLIELQGADTTVITGLRTIEEIETLIEKIPRLEVINIEADVKTRFLRHMKRARSQDTTTIREFEASDEDQASFGLLRVAAEVAGEAIVNEGNNIDVYLRKIRAEQFGRRTRINTSKASSALKFRSELVRSLIALEALRGAATCEQIRDETLRLGATVRLYNTNRALKAVPELAARIEKKGEFLKYKISPHGLCLLRILRAQNKIPPETVASKRFVLKRAKPITKTRLVLSKAKNNPTPVPSLKKPKVAATRRLILKKPLRNPAAKIGRPKR